MRLIDLDPHWIGTYASHDFDTARRYRLGITFRCPGHQGGHCETRLGVFFTNPPDGAPPFPAARTWHRTGDTFEDLSLTPSIDVSQCGHWHGFITKGEVK